MNKKVRKGCKDIWNAFMVKDAVFEKDIPYCPTTGETPESIITWEEAVHIYNKEIASKRVDFKRKEYIYRGYNLKDKFKHIVADFKESISVGFTGDCIVEYQNI